MINRAGLYFNENMGIPPNKTIFMRLSGGILGKTGEFRRIKLLLQINSYNTSCIKSIMKSISR